MKNNNLQIVLYQPEIPFNTGNIGRLCVSNDLSLHLIKPLGFSLDDKYLKRAGLDYWQYLDLKIHESFEELQEYLGKNRNYWYLTTKTQKAYWDIQFTSNDVLVFGQETRGLPSELLAENQTNCLRIPMYSEKNSRSLNLSTSVGIVLYEALRQLN